MTKRYEQAAMLRHCKITARQLDHWTTKGWLVSPQSGQGSGIRHTWDTTERDVAALMGRMVVAGFVPERAARYARDLVEGDIGMLTLGPGLTITAYPTAC